MVTPTNIGVLSRVQVTGSSLFVPLTFVAYDYFITLGREVELFWKGPLTFASTLFFANRYSTFLFNLILGIMLCLPESETVAPAQDRLCESMRLLAGIAYFPFVPWAVFSGLRAYAMSRKWTMSALVTTLSAAPVVVHFILYALGTMGVFVPPSICPDSVVIPPMHTALSGVLSRCSLVVGEFILVMLTGISLARESFLRQLSGKRHMTFAGILLWNGTAYFIVLFLTNTLDLIISLDSILRNDHSNRLMIFTAPVTSVLLSRFLLDLQEANKVNVRLSSGASSSSSGDDSALFFTHGAFARADTTLGSIGSMIIFDTADLQ